MRVTNMPNVAQLVSGAVDEGAGSPHARPLVYPTSSLSSYCSSISWAETNKLRLLEPARTIESLSGAKYILTKSFLNLSH